MSLGFGFSLPAYLGAGGAFSGAALNLDFTSGNNTLSPEITFSRTTNATLTNSAGLVANAPMNLLTFSEQFDNAAWVKAGVTVTANTTAAPDGSLTSDTITSGSANAYIYQVFSATVATYTFSVWIKSVSVGTSLELNLYTNTGASSVGAAVITTTGSWQRVSVTGTFASASATAWAAIGGNASFSTGETIYVWGAQLETNATATTYNSTTVKNLLGYTENFDNAAWTKSNAFVQTNLLTYSQDFTNAAWVKDANRGSFATNAVSPIGDATAQTLTAGTDGYGYTFRTVAATVGVAYAYSIYAKAGTSNFAYIEMSGFGISYVNLTTLAISAAAGVTVTATSVGSGWVRITGVASASATSHVIAFGGSNASGSQVMTSGNTVIVWGAQLVQGTSAGDYKATYGSSAPVGYTDIYGQPFAQKLVESAVTGFRSIYQGNARTVGTVYTQTVYAKAGERNWLDMTVGTLVNGHAWFDLANGVVGSKESAISSTAIQAVGGGWYRCSMVYTETTSTTRNFTLAPTTGDNIVSYTGDGTSGIYIFGAQLSDSASVDPYVYQPVAAPTSTAYYGPRFDYDPVTLQPKGLLIEEQRTNLLTYSEQFDNAAWAKTGSSIVTANSAVAPNGTTTADLWTRTLTSASYAEQGVTKAASALTYAFSVYAKKSVGNYFALRIQGNYPARSDVVFDLVSGTVSGGPASITFTNASATITPVGNGWYRCTIIATSDTATVFSAISSFNSNGQSVDGTDSASNSAGYLWGAQLEAGAFATSYIPTVASQVTRAADSASIIGNNFARWFNASAGTLFSQFDLAATTAASGGMAPTSIDNGSVNGYLIYKGGGSAGISGYVGTNFAGIGTAQVNVSAKTAVAYDGVNNAGSMNGATPAAITASVVTLPTQLQIGRSLSGSNIMSGHVSRISYYNRRLSNTELQGITA